MLASVDFDFIGYKANPAAQDKYLRKQINLFFTSKFVLRYLNVLFQTPIEIKSDLLGINQTLAKNAPEIVRYRGMPNCKK